MALTQLKTGAIADDAVTTAKLAAGTDGHVITYDASGNPTTVGPGTDGQVLTSTGAGSPPAFETISSVGGGTGVDFNDDIKARFGTGNDIEIYHSSDQSYIKNSTGNLRIETDALRLRSKTGTENYLKADVNGAVEVYHDNSKKLETASTGATVTGALALAASSGDNPTINNADGGNGNSMYFNTGGGAKLIIQNDGHTRPASNNTYDLGTSSDRWRKVYTNGILFNGDTAAANTLDDYEEGTFTPTMTFDTHQSNPAGTFTAQYQKVGNIVHFHARFALSSEGSGINSIHLSNLPFTPNVSSYTHPIATFYAEQGVNTGGANNMVFGKLVTNAYQFKVCEIHGSGNLDHFHMNMTEDTSIFGLYGSYFTDS